ncbi:MAG: Flp pilus assembly complex ATPase component TadA [Deltaproteobacteria bacterium]|nr:MAG: Flp pilus assembly complex ATPase component TadA [Deltaproteobacteria bacterium]
MKAELDTRLNEAEVCRSMGLYDESLSIYEQLLSLIPEKDARTTETIKKKIDAVKQEMADRTHTESSRVTAEDISMLKKKLSGQESGRDILSGQTLLDSAASFKELGLYVEAINEYEKLIFQGFPPDKIVADFTECLLKNKSPDKVVDYINNLTDDQRLEKDARARVKYYFGQEMEKRDHKEPALDLYKSALQVNPADTEIKKRVNALTAGFASGSKYDYLLKQKKVTKDQLQKAFALSKKMKKSVEFVLTGQYGLSKAAIGKSFSLYYGCPFRDYDPAVPTPTELLGNLKEAFLLNEGWVPFSWDKDAVEVLVDDPRDLNKTDNIKALLNTPKINFSVAIKEDIEEFIKRFYAENQQLTEGEVSEDGVDDYDLIPDVSFEEDEDYDDDIEEVDESSSKVVKLVDQCIIAAYRKGSSDIHIEPSPITKATSIRFRMDGVCQDYLKVPNSMARAILSRIKIMSHLDIAERRLPQDGKIKFKRKGIPSFELRVATLPTAGGYEDAVMRILAKAGAMQLEDMGLTKRNYTVLKKAILNPYGLILCVGPTGSGKTTTLHSALAHINKPGVKIWTAEDPVEITQAGLRQVEVKPRIGLDFARVMRAFLRADPDIIMIGEMRDEETASIGVEASLTGHLVLSTLHTNSAPETVTRLLDMGLNPLNFSDAFLAVLAQRLVRRLCADCSKDYNPAREEFQEIVSDYGKKMFEKTGIIYSSEVTLKRPGACASCSSTGYRGRMGIHELMEGTDEIKRMIKKATPTEMLFAQAIKEGMTTLKQDGIMKAFQGHTDVSEVRRVCIN